MAWLHAAQSRRVDGPACARDSAAHVSEDVEGMARASCLRTCASAPCCLNSTGACACSASMCAYAGASMRGAHCRINKNTPMRPMLFTVPPLTNARNTHTHPQHTHPRTAPLLPRTHAPTRAHRWVDCGPVAASAPPGCVLGQPRSPRAGRLRTRAPSHIAAHTAAHTHTHTHPGRPARDSAHMHHSLRCTCDWPRSGCQRRRSCDGVRRLLQGKSCTLPAHTRSARIYARTLQAHTQNARTRTHTRTRVPDVQPWPWVQPARCAALISDRRPKGAVRAG